MPDIVRLLWGRDYSGGCRLLRSVAYGDFDVLASARNMYAVRTISPSVYQRASAVRDGSARGPPFELGAYTGSLTGMTRIAPYRDTPVVRPDGARPTGLDAYAQLVLLPPWKLL